MAQQQHDERPEPAANRRQSRPLARVDALISRTVDIISSTRPLTDEQHASLLDVLHFMMEECTPPPVVFRGRVHCAAGGVSHEADIFDVGARRVSVCQHCGDLRSFTGWAVEQIGRHDEG